MAEVKVNTPQEGGYEVEVYPEYWQTWLKNYLPQSLRDNFFNRESGEMTQMSGLRLYNPYLNYEDSEEDQDYAKSRYVHEASRRLYDLLQKEGAPTIYTNNNSPLGIMFHHATKAINKGWDRPFTHPVGNFVYIGDGSTHNFIQEKGHDIQQKYGNTSVLDDLKVGFKRIHPDFDPYDTPGTNEHQTHVDYPDPVTGESHIGGFADDIFNWIYQGNKEKRDKAVWWMK